MSLVGSGMLGCIEQREDIFQISVHIAMKNALVALRKDTAMLLCKIVVAEFHTVFVFVAVQLINIDSH